MRAFVHCCQSSNDWTPKCGTGSHAGWITNEYKTLDSMIRYAFKGMAGHYNPSGRWLVEIYVDFDKCYGTPDLTLHMEYQCGHIVIVHRIYKHQAEQSK